MLFSWLRNRVKNAFLSGIGDAIGEIENGDHPDTSTAIALLRARLQPALPAPAPEHEGNGQTGGKKAKAKTSE